MSEFQFSRARRGYIVGVLTLVYALNLIDRQIVIILQDQIKHEFALSDKQLGLMTGLAFVCLYSVCSLLFAPLADRHVRRTIIAAAIALWSAATASVGLAQSYSQLLLARVGVGVGEAGSGPAAYSMIADMFPEERRGFPTALFSSGVYFGILCGFAGGGWLGATLGWRHTLIVLGFVGLVIAVLVRLTVAEPERQRPTSPQSAISTLQVFRIMLRNKAFTHLLVGCALFAMVGTGSNAFMPSYMMRVHGLSVATVGAWLGLVLGVGGAVGSLVSGVVADRLGGSSVARYPILVGSALAISLPFYLGAFLAPSGAVALGLYCVAAVLYPMYLTPSIMVTYRTVPPEARARATALVLILFTGIGLGIGPLAVGVLSDIFTPRYGPDGLRYALAVTAMVGGVWSIIHQVMAYRRMREAVAYPV